MQEKIDYVTEMQEKVNYVTEYVTKQIQMPQCQAPPPPPPCGSPSSYFYQHPQFHQQPQATTAVPLEDASPIHHNRHPQAQSNPAPPQSQSFAGSGSGSASFGSY